MTGNPMVLAGAAAASAILAVVFGFLVISSLREWQLRRTVLSSIRGEALSSDEAEAQASVIRLRDAEQDGLVAALGGKVPQVWDLYHLLAQSGLGWTVGGFLGRSALVAVVLGVASGVAFGATVGMIAFLTGAWLPYAHARRKKAKRILQLDSQLPDAIDLIARAVRAGHPLSEGLRMAAEEAPEPLASEFRITFEEQRFGLPFEEAMLGLGDRVEVVDVRILITAILVQREVGGNLSEILEKIAETMRERFNLKRQVRVYTAQGRMSGYTLAALPIFVGLVITLINPEYMRTLFDESFGRGLLMSAAFMQGIGFLWIRRIVDIRY